MCAQWSAVQVHNALYARQYARFAASAGINYTVYYVRPSRRPLLPLPTLSALSAKAALLCTD